MALAQAIHAAPGLAFMGLMTYPPVGAAAKVEAFRAETMRLLDQRGIACPIRPNGGSPDLFKAHEVSLATEHRSGTYVYNDRSMERAGYCAPDDMAMHVLATVVSRPVPGRAVLDAGSKALTSDLLGFSDHGCIEGHEDARIVGLSEEHAVVEIGADFPPVGAQVRIVPNHTCVVSNLFDRIVFHRDGRVTRVETVDARGTVWSGRAPRKAAEMGKGADENPPPFRRAYFHPPCAGATTPLPSRHEFAVDKPARALVRHETRRHRIFTIYETKLRNRP
ncbi:MAG: hypothetical protein QM682_02555 [Paracoccus sp. (in: a-proteobacteria)]|uniref:hypothetical protein n=1 Tax=Paracoccus sp. TaxID=267 RepID=UPI0039E5E4A9